MAIHLEPLGRKKEERPIESRNCYTVNAAFDGLIAERLYRACREKGEWFDEAAIAVVRQFVAPREEHENPIAATASEKRPLKKEWPAILAKGAAGLLPRAVASLILDAMRPDFVYYDHSKKEGVKGEKATSSLLHLKVMSYNVAALAPFIAQRNGLKPALERLEEIASEILEGDADVTCLQEAFDPLFSEALVDRVKEKYPYAIANVGPGVGVSSGNLVLSKYPIKRAEYEEFADHGGAEKTCRKGPLIVTVDKEGHCVNIIATHLNGGAPIDRKYPHGGGSCRRAQVDQVRRFAEFYFEKSPYPTFLAADTNMEFDHIRTRLDGTKEKVEGDPEFRALYRDYEINLGHFHSDGKGTDVQMYDGSAPGVARARREGKKSEGKGAVPDYIAKAKYLRDGYSARLTDYRTQNSYDASDHYAIVAEFEISPEKPKAKL